MLGDISVSTDFQSQRNREIYNCFLNRDTRDTGMTTQKYWSLYFQGAYSRIV